MDSATKKIAFSEISPFVRYARIQRDSFYKIDMYPCDNRLFYCLDGSGAIEIDGKCHHVEKDTVIMWRCGRRYRYLPESSSPFYFAAVNFDFTGENASLATPIYPLETSKFSEEKLVERVEITDVPRFGDVISKKNAVHLRDSFEAIEREYRWKKLFHEKKCSGLLTGILCELARDTISDSTGGGQRMLDLLLQFVQIHCSEPISNESLGRLFSYHPNYINALVVKNTGLSLHKYLIGCRIRKAAELLRESELSVTEISQQCGFSEPAYFSRYFKKHCGCTPGEFRHEL